jgi:ferredoxin-nitrate reductase
VGRYLGHWHTMTRTAHVERVGRSHPEPRLEVHPEDAARAGLRDGGRARVRSRRGCLEVRVWISHHIRPGTVFLPMHWGAASGELACEANRLMHELACPIAKQPELKGAAVRLQPAPPAAADARAPAG